MKPIALFILCVVLMTLNTNAQIKYENILELKPGERIEKYLSCWWLTDKGQIASLVIRQADGKLSAIENGIRKNDLTQDEILTKANCEKLNPYKVPRESHVKFAALQSDGQYRIRSGNRDFGVYDKILFMRENESHFVAVVSTRKDNTERYFYIDDGGKKELLDGRPQNFYTNSQLTKAAVMLFDKDAMPAELINKLPRDQQVAVFEKMRTASAQKQIWISDGHTYTVDKKSKLFFDASGMHFIEASPIGVFYVDGKQHNKNVSGGGTIVFVNDAGDNWAYFYEIYLTFKDNVTIKEAINPYLTTENGKSYLHWYKVDEDAGKVVVRRGRKEL